MHFEVLPPETLFERQVNQYRRLLNDKDIAFLESLDLPSDINDEAWYANAFEKARAAGLGWNGPAVHRWLEKQLSTNETV